MSPRRSFRSRTTQASAGTSQLASSSSSTSSSRAERNTRSSLKASSPTKSASPASVSSQDGDDDIDTLTSIPPQTRRRRRERNDEDDAIESFSGRDDLGGDTKDGDAEEEITRCVCGLLDYPGPQPALIRTPRPVPKAEVDADGSIINQEPPSDELGGLFIQCDDCKVWQHGGCVGIMDEGMSPDEYYCELCRPDLHKLSTGPNGSRSRYQPVLGSSRAGSPGASTVTKAPVKRGPRDKSGRANALSYGKKRSTMNSRDAAYDEEEQLRIAIEESKAQKAANLLEAANRSGKRSRSGSDENHSQKRRRTSSASSDQPSASGFAAAGQTTMEAEEDAGGAPPDSLVRGASARAHRERESREKEKETARMEAAGRRKGRAEKRRGDDSDPSEEDGGRRSASAKEADVQEPSKSGQARGESPAPSPGLQNAAPTRKTGRQPARRGRIGRNQYTKDRDDNSHARDTSMRRTQSREVGGEDAPGPNGGPHHHGVNGDGHKTGKARHANPHRTSMNEMRKRVAAILEFISRVQVEMAEELTPPSSGGETATAAMVQNLAGSLPMIKVDGSTENTSEQNGDGAGEKDFNQLSTLEMMDVLTGKLLMWQREFGK
ncbi:MAG: hypothetical protein M1825_001314 [Sarcosagium campestre]|nr:MAG: hypothetical protein M1825_001314 [Sarcosagium campestre]